jgi:hypothetical protein
MIKHVDLNKTSYEELEDEFNKFVHTYIVKDLLKNSLQLAAAY